MEGVFCEKLHFFEFNYFTSAPVYFSDLSSQTVVSSRVLHVCEIAGGPTQKAVSPFALLSSSLLMDTGGAFRIFTFSGSYSVHCTGKLHLCRSMK